MVKKSFFIIIQIIWDIIQRIRIFQMCIRDRIDHVQVSYSNDDSFEWFGGTVNCKYLVAYKGWDDDFDTENGFSGKVQYGLSLRDSKIADTSQINGFESDNCADGATVDPRTKATFSNICLLYTSRCV